VNGIGRGHGGEYLAGAPEVTTIVGELILQSADLVTQATVVNPKQDGEQSHKRSTENRCKCPPSRTQLHHAGDARLSYDCGEQSITRTYRRLRTGDAERKQCGVGLKLMVFAPTSGTRLKVLAKFGGAVFRQLSESEHYEVVSELVVIGH
jgi:hypothetical protein